MRKIGTAVKTVVVREVFAQLFSKSWNELAEKGIILKDTRKGTTYTITINN
jgi:hypothetical protein